MSIRTMRSMMKATQLMIRLLLNKYNTESIVFIYDELCDALSVADHHDACQTMLLLGERGVPLGKNSPKTLSAVSASVRVQRTVSRWKDNPFLPRYRHSRTGHA